MSTTEIGETVKVLAVFDSGMRPLRFDWNGRVCRISEVTYTWQTKEGRDSLLHFSVAATDEGSSALFELTFNQTTMRWRLERVES